MKRRTASALRRLANKLDPQAAPQVSVTYNGQPANFEKAVVTALARHQRRNGLGRLA